MANNSTLGNLVRTGLLLGAVAGASLVGGVGMDYVLADNNKQAKKTDKTKKAKNKPAKKTGKTKKAGKSHKAAKNSELRKEYKQLSLIQESFKGIGRDGFSKAEDNAYLHSIGESLMKKHNLTAADYGNYKITKVWEEIVEVHKGKENLGRQGRVILRLEAEDGKKGKVQNLEYVPNDKRIKALKKAGIPYPSRDFARNWLKLINRVATKVQVALDDGADKNGNKILDAKERQAYDAEVSRLSREVNVNARKYVKLSKDKQWAESFRIDVAPADKIFSLKELKAAKANVIAKLGKDKYDELSKEKLVALARDAQVLNFGLPLSPLYQATPTLDRGLLGGFFQENYTKAGYGDDGLTWNNGTILRGKNGGIGLVYQRSVGGTISPRQNPKLLLDANKNRDRLQAMRKFVNMTIRNAMLPYEAKLGGKADGKITLTEMTRFVHLVGGDDKIVTRQEVMDWVSLQGGKGAAVYKAAAPAPKPTGPGVDKNAPKTAPAPGLLVRLSGKDAYKYMGDVTWAMKDIHNRKGKNPLQSAELYESGKLVLNYKRGPKDTTLSREDYPQWFSKAHWDKVQKQGVATVKVNTAQKKTFDHARAQRKLVAQGKAEPFERVVSISYAEWNSIRDDSDKDPRFSRYDAMISRARDARIQSKAYFQGVKKEWASRWGALPAQEVAKLSPQDRTRYDLVKSHAAAVHQLEEQGFNRRSFNRRAWKENRNDFQGRLKEAGLLQSAYKGPISFRVSNDADPNAKVGIDGGDRLNLISVGHTKILYPNADAVESVLYKAHLKHK